MTGWKVLHITNLLVFLVGYILISLLVYEFMDPAICLQHMHGFKSGGPLPQNTQ